MIETKLEFGGIIIGLLSIPLMMIATVLDYPAGVQICLLMATCGGLIAIIGIIIDVFKGLTE